MNTQVADSHPPTKGGTEMKMNLLGKGIEMDSPTMNMKAKLSTLWIFMLLNVSFDDIHGLLKPGFLEEIMTGTVNGTQMTEGLLLLGAVMIEVPIAMVLLSRVLKYRVNRWVNIIAGAMTIALVINNRPAAPDQIFFATIEVVTMLLIVWYAWKWPNPELSPKNKI